MSDSQTHDEIIVSLWFLKCMLFFQVSNCKKIADLQLYFLS